MAKRKKISLLLCSLVMLFTSLFFVGCGGIDYSSVSISCDQNAVVMSVGDETNLTFTINNFQKGMNGQVYISQTGTSVSTQIISQKDNVTVVNVKALEGGKSTIVAKCEGQKECVVVVDVNAYSDSFENSSNTLYVTQTKSLMPNSSDFVFDAQAQLRDVEFYFYGRAYSQNLTLEDVQNDAGEFEKGFVKVSLYDDKYLIFENKDGKVYTISNFVDNGKNNPISFESVEVANDGEYIISENAYIVEMGDHFTFVVYYSSAPEKQLFVQRDFYVFSNIDSSLIENQYYYLDSNGSPILSDDQEEILLVPNKEGGVGAISVKYNKAVVEISLPVNCDNISLETSFDNPEYFNKIADKPVEQDGKIIYKFEITSNSSTPVESVFNVRFYYDALKDVQDDEVSYKLSIPISIKYQPSKISVNNETGDSSETQYLFYNQYKSSYVGWKTFNINMTPNDANYESITLEFDPKKVNIRYNGIVYTDGIVTFTKEHGLPLLVEIRGLGSNGELGDGTVKVTLNYDLLGKGSIEYNILYTIKEGASILNFTDEEFEKQIYLPYSSQEVFTFDGLFADAGFSAVEYQFVSGQDVVNLSYNANFEATTANTVATDMTTKAVGSGVYAITLDNGVSKQVRITVVEELKNLHVETANTNSAIKKLELKDDGLGAEIYILNDSTNFGEHAQFNLIANYNRQSTAILSCSPNVTGSGFAVDYEIGNIINFTVNTTSNGNGTINFTIQSQVVEGFKISQQTTTYTVDLVSYSAISGIKVEKNNDGKGIYEDAENATYVYLYSNTDITSAKTANFSVSLKNNSNSGYLFKNPIKNVDGKFDYVKSEFNEKFIYWTVPGLTITKNGVEVDSMYYDASSQNNNLYQISNIATFDTSTMTLTAIGELGTSFNLIATVEQYAMSYSFPIQVIISEYIEVKSLSFSKSTEELTFSAMKPYQEVVVYLSDSTAINKDIQIIFEPATVNQGGKDQKAYIFGEKNEGITIEQIGKDGLTYLIKFDASAFANDPISGSDESLTGTLKIVATDWLNDVGTIKNEKSPLVLTVDIKYRNGTKANPYYLETAEDVLNMKNSLASHYEINSTIDMTGYSDQLPLGPLTGSITGTSQYAKITGLEIKNYTNIETDDVMQGAYFGLFTYIAQGAEINYVEFVGHFDIDLNNVSGANQIAIGLIAGINQGNLVNVSVQMDDNSTIVSNGTFIDKKLYFGAVSGVNMGSIIQDFSVFSTNDSSFSPKILVYSSEYKTDITFNSVGTESRVYAGGVVGWNGKLKDTGSGIIQKIKNDNLSLIGYGNYMAYNNITVTVPEVKKGENVVSTDYVGGIAGMSASGSQIVSDGTTADNSLVVGGFVKGRGIVGGVVGEVQSGATIKGLTARIFVRGYNSVGAISAITATGVTGNNSTFFVQAVDDLRLGIEASMIIKYGQSTLSEEEYDENQIAFGIGEHGLAIFNEKKPLLTYITRNHDNRTEITSGDQSSYYGDYVEVGATGDGSSQIIYAKFFTKDNVFLSVLTNEDDGFVSFVDKSTNYSTSDLFYMFYFKAASVNVNDDNDEALFTAQTLLDENYNTISSDNSLYPIIASSGTILTSQNSNILTIDQSGKMSVKGTGTVTVSASSVLNMNSTSTITIYVVNYFNQSEVYSVVYPSYSGTAVPLENGSEIELLGNQTVYQYVRPNYTLVDNGQTIMTAEGLMNISNISVQIANNSTLTTSFDLTTEETATLYVDIHGQTVSISRGDVNEDRNFIYSVRPKLEVSLNNKTYVAYVNKGLNNVVVNYKRGANSIQTLYYDSVTLVTGQTVVEKIFIDSNVAEEKPYYTLRNERGDIVQATFDGINVIEDEEFENLFADTKLFDVNFDFINQTDLASQEIKFTLKVDENSKVYGDRYNQNIYGNYYLTVYPKSDTSKSVLIKIVFEQVNINAVVVDNYNDFADIQENAQVGSTSEIAVPGQYGLLAITIEPEMADFDYITIKNTETAQQSGNGSALFGVVAKISNPNGEGLFSYTTIHGSAMGESLTITLDEIIEAYNQTGFEKFHGVIYLRYIIGTNGVVDGGKAEFEIAPYIDGVKQKSTAIKTLKLSLQNYVDISIEGKEETADNKVYVARGLKYKLNIDSYGFNSNEITLKSDNPEVASIIVENGEYYLQITSNSVNYGDNDSFVVNITAEGLRMEGDIPRTSSDTLELNILDFVLNYNPDKDKNSDIVSGMSNGIINIQIGNKITYTLDFSDFIEYDQTNSYVVSRVQNFMNEMTKSGTWMVYTNLNESGVSSGESVSIENGEYVTSYNLQYNDLTNKYFSSTTNLTVQPLMTHNAGTNFYVFTYSGYYKVSKGGYSYASDSASQQGSNRLYTEFSLNVYLSSSEKHPIPISTYEELMNMYPNSYYILMNDIVLDNTSFKPINVAFKSFDGNGYTIKFVGNYDFGSSSNIGLFERVYDGSVVKNLTVSISGGELDTTYNQYMVKFKTTSSAFNIGLIAGENSGAITNCYVYNEQVQNSNYVNYLTVTSSSFEDVGYIAGITATNLGVVTNSRSALYAYAPYNIAGLVGINSGVVASSYFKNGVLIGNSRNQNLAGLVLNNSESGKILTSYVSGNNDTTHLYSSDTQHYLQSTTPEGGFVYENSGEISDCYSNIKITGSSQMAGFVFKNTGNIKNCFSTSILQDSLTSSAGFAMDNSDGDNGTFADCYYFASRAEDEDQEGGNQGENDQKNDINGSLKPLNIPGIVELDEDGFASLSENFSNYVYSNSLDTKTVWFYSNGYTSSDFNNTVFAKGRLELASANVIAFSQQEFLSSETDSTTGDVTYTYKYVSDALGSLKNPRLIYDAYSMESEIVEAAGASLSNNQNVRLIDNVDYTDYSGLSNTYKIIFSGTFEGNGLSINGSNLVSTENLTSAGFFAQIGKSALSVGTVMNLDISPKYVTFNNANSVGGLAGIVKYGRIYNVTISSQDNMTVSGNNFVGGLIGRAESSYDFKNLSSSVSVTAIYKSNSKDSLYSDGAGNIENYSYAGGLFGYLGTGNANEISSEQIASIMGDRAGLVVGVIGKNANISNVYSTISSETKIKAYTYGGLVAGEIAGTIKEVSVKGTEDATASIFSLDFAIPTAVGGITGAISGGTIEKAVVDKSFNVGSSNSASTSTSRTVQYVGGIAGIAKNAESKISQVVVEKNITASGENLGGAVGCADVSIKLSEIAIKSKLLKITGQNSSIYLGGLIGRTKQNVEIDNSYVESNIEADVYNYRAALYAYVGGLIGDDSLRNPHITYTYTRSQIDVKLKDMGSVLPEQDYASYIENNPGQETNKTFKNEQNTANCTEVYYYGTSSPDYTNYASFGSYTIKPGTTQMNYNINNYGVDSFSLASNHNLSSDKISTIEALRNIFTYEAEYEGEQLTYRANFENLGEAYVDSANATYLYALYNSEYIPDEITLDKEDYTGYMVKYSYDNDKKAWLLAKGEHVGETKYKLITFDKNNLVYDASGKWQLLTGEFSYLKFEDNLYWL